LYVDNGQEEEFHKLRPDLSMRQTKLLCMFYELKREVEPTKRIPTELIEKLVVILPYEDDCSKVTIQAVDDFYIELYVKKLKSRIPK
jgi:hypothetical protein